MDIVIFSENADLAQRLMKILFAEWPKLICIHDKTDFFRFVDEELDADCIVTDFSSFSARDLIRLRSSLSRHPDATVIAIVRSQFTLARIRHAGIQITGFLQEPVPEDDLIELVAEVIRKPDPDLSIRVLTAREAPV